MSDAPPPTTSLEAIGAHIWHLQQSQAQTNALLAKMATHEDIKAINATIANLATRTELDQKVGALREELVSELNRNKPSTIGRAVVSFVAGLLVLVAGFGLLLKVADWVNHPLVMATPAAGKP
jgi:hypothetical protein